MSGKNTLSGRGGFNEQSSPFPTKRRRRTHLYLKAPAGFGAVKIQRGPERIILSGRRS